MAGVFSRFIGRRHALWIACALNAVACAIQIGTTNKGVLYFGRLVLGFANGFLVTFSNVYTAEASPAHLRGIGVALFAYWVNIGSIFGSIVDNYMSDRLDKASYRVPIACLYIVPTFLTVALFWVPESPRWLLYRGREASARSSLERLRGSIAQDQVELEWAEMVRGVLEEQAAAETVGFLDMFRGSNLRRTLLSYSAIVSQNSAGFWVLINYQTYFMAVAGVAKPFKYSIMNTCIGLSGVTCGMFAMQRLFGRRTMLMLGSGSVGLWFLCLAISASVKTTNTAAVDNCVVAFFALIYFCYNGGVGAVSYPLCTEVVSSQLRAWTVGTATSLGYVLAWLTTFCTPYFINPTALNWVRLP